MSLTKKDLEAIQNLVKITIDDELEEKLEEKLKHFPTKEEFFNKMDEVMKELKGIKENHLVLTHQVSNHEDRLQMVEKKLQIQTS